MTRQSFREQLRAEIPRQQKKLRNRVGVDEIPEWLAWPGIALYLAVMIRYHVHGYLDLALIAPVMFIPALIWWLIFGKIKEEE